MEINARAAVEAGVRLAIDTDAHGSEGPGGIGFGLSVARRAWVSPRDVINCMSAGELKKFLARKR